MHPVLLMLLADERVNDFRRMAAKHTKRARWE